MEPTAADSSLPGQIGRYRVLGRIGAGGMGTVYRAHDPQLDRIVALKAPRLDGPPEQRAKLAARFQREARAAAQVFHPHVCPILDVGEHDGQPFVVMALVAGPSLAERLARQGRLDDVGQVIALTLQVLDALAAVHAAGITHRDIKPGNVLLDAAGRAVLTDFGLARSLEQAEHLTSEGVVLGTPSYMAPEQAAGLADRVGPSTDLYGVGVVLYQMLTGRLPFEGPTLTVLHRIVHEEPPPPRQYRPDLDPGLEAVVLKALRKDPAARPASAAAFAEALRVCLPSATATTAAVPASPPRPPSTEATQPVRRGKPRRWVLSRRLGWLAGDALVMLGAVGLVLLTWPYLQGREMKFDDICPILGIGSLSCLAVFLGMQLWQLVERFHTPEGLFHSVKGRSVIGVQMALAAGAPPDSQDEFGDTPLIKAASDGNLELVKLLLGAGASTTVRNQAGQTARDAARAGGRHDVVALLDLATPSARPAADPVGVWRPRWGVRLALVAALGVLIPLGVAFVCWPWPVSAVAFEGMLTHGELSRVEDRGRVVIGQKNELVFPEDLRPDYGRGRVWSQVGPPYAKPAEALRKLAPGVVWEKPSSYFANPQALCPTLPEAAVLVALPVAVISLVFWPLRHMRFVFPLLAPPRRRR